MVTVSLGYIGKTLYSFTHLKHYQKKRITYCVTVDNKNRSNGIKLKYVRVYIMFLKSFEQLILLNNAT